MQVKQSPYPPGIIYTVSTNHRLTSLTGVAVSSDLGLSWPVMTAMAAASAGTAPRLSAKSSAIFMNLSAAALGTALRDLTTQN